MTVLKSRRRPVRAASPVVRSTRSSLSERIAAMAASRSARTAYIVIGTAGLAALAVAVIGPRRINRQVLTPLRGVVEDQADKLWTDSRDLRRQVAQLFDQAGPRRDALVRNFQSWVGHFRAS